MFWIASARKIYAVTEQNFNEEWNKKGGSNDLLREQFIITLLVLLFLGGKNCEINFWACDPEKIVNCRINLCEFAENLWICRNYFSEKSKRLYFDNQTLLNLHYSLIPSAEFIFIFILEINHLHLIHSPLVWITPKKNFLALLIA